MDLPDAVQASLAITDLFRFPTVRTLARRIGGTQHPDPAGAPSGSDRASLRRGALAARRGAVQRSG